MKEATGELNMTVVTIVAVGALATFFYLVIWPTIRNNMALSSACNASSNGNVSYTDNDAKIVCGSGQCTYDGKITRVCENNNSN